MTETMFSHQADLHRLPVFLAAVLLGDRKSSEDAAVDLLHRKAWSDALALSRIWCVVPQLARCVQEFSLPIDQITEEQLRNAVAAVAAQSMLIMHRCSTIFSQLPKVDVRAVAFKGVGLVGNLYSSPAERMMKDIDLLIDQADLQPTIKVLKKLGFTPETDRLEDYVDFLENRCLCFTDNSGIEVDLHWSLTTGDSPAAMTADRVLSHAVVVNMYDTPIHVTSAVDSMLLTIHHILQHNFAPFEVVKDHCDLAMWWKVQRSRWEIKDVIKQARLRGLVRPALAAWRILSHFNPISSANQGIAALEESTSDGELEDAEQLKELFEVQLSERTVDPVILRLLMNPLSMNRYIASRISNGANNIHVAPHSARYGGLHRLLLAEASNILLELVHFNPRRMALYRSLLRAHRRYQSYRQT